MQLDKKAIDNLLKLDDTGLWAVIRTIAAQSGIDLPKKISQSDISSIRKSLGSASEADIAGAARILSKFKEQNGG